MAIMHTHSDQMYKKINLKNKAEKKSKNTNILLHDGKYLLQRICQNTLTKGHKTSFLIRHERGER